MKPCHDDYGPAAIQRRLLSKFLRADPDCGARVGAATGMALADSASSAT